MGDLGEAELDQQITIDGGTILAVGGTGGGAGIGGGLDGKGGTIVLKGTPKIKAVGGTAAAQGIGRGEGTASEGTLNIDDLATTPKLQVSDSDDVYVDYVATRKKFMKTPNYVEPEP